MTHKIVLRTNSWTGNETLLVDGNVYAEGYQISSHTWVSMLKGLGMDASMEMDDLYDSYDLDDLDDSDDSDVPECEYLYDDGEDYDSEDYEYYNPDFSF